MKLVKKDWISISWVRVRSKDLNTPVVRGYYVERKEENATKWVRCNQVRLKRTTYCVFGLVEFAEYRFRVLAENDVGIGKASNPSKVVQCKEPDDTLPPPSNFEVVSVSKDSVILAWQKPIADMNISRVQGYIIEYRETSMVTWKQCHEDKLIFECVYQADNLKSGGEYEFRVFAVNKAGKSHSAKLNEPVLIQSASDDKPRLVEPIKKAVVMRGKTAALTCSIQGLPVPDISWLRFGKEVQRGKKYKVNWDGRISGLD